MRFVKALRDRLSKRGTPLRRRRGISFQPLERRELLVAELDFDFTPSTGSVVSENGNLVLELPANTDVTLTATVTATEPVNGRAFQLNFQNADLGANQLGLSQWLADESIWAESFGNNNLFGGGGVQTPTSVPLGTTPVALGAFTLTTPGVGGDFLLTTNFPEGAFRTAITDVVDNLDIPIADYGELVIRVDGGNITPSAEDDSYTAAQGETLTVDAASGVTANDVANGAITASVVDDVDNGQLTLNADGSFTYTPNNFYHGQDSFQYEFTDGGQTFTATVDLTVETDAPWRHPVNPFDANDDGVFVPRDILVLVNRINEIGSITDLEPPGGGLGSPPVYVDVTGDNNFFPNDILFAVNEINNNGSSGEAEGEGEALLVVSGETAEAFDTGTEETVVQQAVDRVDVPLDTAGARPRNTPVDNGKSDSDENEESLLDILARDQTL